MLRLLFRILRLIGDVKAIRKGRYGRRLSRRYAHRSVNRMFR